MIEKEKIRDYLDSHKNDIVENLKAKLGIITAEAPLAPEILSKPKYSTGIELETINKNKKRVKGR